jgi:hypothetical protein
METTLAPGWNRPAVCGPFSSTSQQNSWPKTVSAPFVIWLKPPTLAVRSIMWS